MLRSLVQAPVKSPSPRRWSRPPPAQPALRRRAWPDRASRWPSPLGAPRIGWAAARRKARS